MIDPELKNKLLNELEKSGNIYVSCAKMNISRNTYYRWFSSDTHFRKRAKKSLRLGRENLCDIAEHALMCNVKEKKLDAIKYVLSHNSPRYRSNRSAKVIIEHRSNKHIIENPPITLEDLLDQAKEDNDGKESAKS
jgi:hypothetical protein